MRITEIFFSLQGESTLMGLPTVFVRLTGCPLRCQYCDTAYAFHGGKTMSVSQILEAITPYQTRYVTITGGEPLAQPEVNQLMKQLCDQGYTVSLETSGAIDIQPVDPRVIKIVDIKTPGSNEVSKNLWQNLSFLLPHDQLKFVICDRQDYEWSKQKIAELRLTEKCTVLFSPSYLQLSPQMLADWIVADQLPIRFQIQLHKYIWGDTPGK